VIGKNFPYFISKFSVKLLSFLFTSFKIFFENYGGLPQVKTDFFCKQTGLFPVY